MKFNEYPKELIDAMKKIYFLCGNKRWSWPVPGKKTYIPPSDILWKIEDCADNSIDMRESLKQFVKWEEAIDGGANSGYRFTDEFIDEVVNAE